MRYQSCNTWPWKVWININANTYMAIYTYRTTALENSLHKTWVILNGLVWVNWYKSSLSFKFVDATWLFSKKPVLPCSVSSLRWVFISWNFLYHYLFSLPRSKAFFHVYELQHRGKEINDFHWYACTILNSLFSTLIS